jgi:hypothetical protein
MKEIVKWLNTPNDGSCAGSLWEVLRRHGSALKICQRGSNGGVFQWAYVKQEECEEVPLLDEDDFERWLEKDLENFKQDSDRRFLEVVLDSAPGPSNPIARYIQALGFGDDIDVLEIGALANGRYIRLPEKLQQFNQAYVSQFGYRGHILPHRAILIWQSLFQKGGVEEENERRAHFHVSR